MTKGICRVWRKIGLDSWRRYHRALHRHLLESESFHAIEAVNVLSIIHVAVVSDNGLHIAVVFLKLAGWDQYPSWGQQSSKAT
jgi:hypothetical protein